MPGSPSGSRRDASRAPSASITYTSWWGRHEARFRDYSRPVSSCRPPEPDVRVGPASGSPQAPSSKHGPQLADGQGEGIVDPPGPAERSQRSGMAPVAAVVWCKTHGGSGEDVNSDAVCV